MAWPLDLFNKSNQQWTYSDLVYAKANKIITYNAQLYIHNTRKKNKVTSNKMSLSKVSGKSLEYDFFFIESIFLQVGIYTA